MASDLSAPATDTAGDEKPKKNKPKTGFQQPTIILPPNKTPLPPVKLPPRPPVPPGGWASTLMKRLAEWVASAGGATLAGIGVFVLAMLSPLEAGVANEWERKLPQEDEERYRALEAKLSAALAKGEKLPLPEEAEWQALEERKYPNGRSGQGPRRNRANEIGDEREQRVAEITGGRVTKNEKGQDVVLRDKHGHKTGLDVLGPNGEYIQVGGPAKAKNLDSFRRQLNITRQAAERDGVEAHVYLEEGTSQEVIDVAIKQLGEENVHIFKIPK